MRVQMPFHWHLCLLLLLACAQATLCTKRSFTLQLHAKQNDDLDVISRRRLLRNSTLPLHGAVKGFGYFYTSVYLGTPPKKFAIIVDTGSSMTYVPCSDCGNGCGPNHQDAAFDPQNSLSAQLIACDSAKCRCGAPSCSCSAAQQCTYTRSYAEQSSSSGVLIEDLLSLHDGGPAVPILFGCESHETGEIFKQKADGLFGLGNSDASVVNQLVAAGEIDDVFSLCFGGVEGDGALLLGRSHATDAVQMQYTPLLSSPTHPFYYNVELTGILVGSQPLGVTPRLFSPGYGTVLDSGTTFTYLPTPAFNAFTEAVETYALQHGLTRVRGPDPQFEDICFGGAPEQHADNDGLSRVFPSMGLQFAPNVTLTLGPLNYLFVHTFYSGKYCLGVFDNGNSGTLLGGITFRNVLVQYDRENKRVGIGLAACRDLGLKYRPPCSMFAAEGSDAAAISDGDCELVEALPATVAPIPTADDKRKSDQITPIGSAFVGELQNNDEAAHDSMHSNAAGTPIGPLAITLLVGILVVLTVALVVALFRPGPRNALGALIPRWRRYEALGDLDTETGGGGHEGETGMDEPGLGTVANEAGNGGAVSSGLKPIVTTSKSTAQQAPSVGFISMTEMSSSHRQPAGTGNLRGVGLKTSQKLQRSNSAFAAAMAEEAASDVGGSSHSGTGGIVLSPSPPNGAPPKGCTRL